MAVKVANKEQNGGAFSELALPGTKGLFKPKQRLWKRVLWTMVIISSLATFALHISWRFERYFSYPITVSVATKEQQEVIYPALTLCLYSPFDSYRFANWRKNLTGDPNYEIQKLLDIPGVDLNVMWNMTSEPIDDLLSKCEFGDPPESCNTLWKDEFMNMGLCHTLEIESGKMHSRNRRSGIHIESQMTLAPSWPRNLLWKALLHDKRLAPTFDAMTLGVILVTNTATRLTYLQKEFQYLNTTRNPCVTIEELNKCRLECYTNYILQGSSCKDPSMKIFNLPLCNNSKDFRKIYSHPRVFNFKYRSGMCKPCTRSCNETVFEVHVDNSIPQNGNISSIININPASTEIFVTTENYAYDFQALFCDIGGALGLYLGISMLTIVEILDLLCQFMFRKILRITRAKK